MIIVRYFSFNSANEYEFLQFGRSFSGIYALDVGGAFGDCVFAKIIIIVGSMSVVCGALCAQTPVITDRLHRLELRLASISHHMLDFG